MCDIMLGSDLLPRVIGLFHDRASVYLEDAIRRFDDRFQRLSVLHGLSTEPGSAAEEVSCIHNLSSIVLTNDEHRVLERGLNFALVPKRIPHTDIIASVESAIGACNNEDKAIVRKKVSTILKRAKKPKQNVTASEMSALKRLKDNDSIMVLPADKGKAVVILDTSEYLDKLGAIVATGPYVKRGRDPGSSFRKSLYQVLNWVVQDGRMTRAEFLRLVPTHFQTPHIFGLPKVHKTGIPLRPIVSMVGSLFSPVSRLLADIMKPYTLSHASHVANSGDVIRRLTSFDARDGFFVSFDVESLFTNVPVPETLEVFRSWLEQDSTLRERTRLSVEEIMALAGIVLSSCYFRSFDGLFLQTEGVAMGGSLGPIAANLFMVHFETLAKTRADEEGIVFPSLWIRYVDDVLAFWNGSEDSLAAFCDLLNSLRPSIKFTLEREEDGLIPYLDVLIDHRQQDLIFSVYRKPTNTGRYLHRSSSHPMSSFKSVVRSLSSRASSVCSTTTYQEEKKHVIDSLKACGYCAAECNSWWSSRSQSNEEAAPVVKGTLPYIKGVSERIRGVLSSVGVNVALKSTTTVRNMLVKKRPEKPKTFGVVYRIPCSTPECNWSYVGESGRTVEERVKEHGKAIREIDVDRSEVAKHVHESDHTVEVSQVEVVDIEPQWKKRIVKEAIWTKHFDSCNKTKHTLSNRWIVSDLQP